MVAIFQFTTVVWLHCTATGIQRISGVKIASSMSFLFDGVLFVFLSYSPVSFLLGLPTEPYILLDRLVWPRITTMYVYSIYHCDTFWRANFTIQYFSCCLFPGRSLEELLGYVHHYLQCIIPLWFLKFGITCQILLQLPLCVTIPL